MKESNYIHLFIPSYHRPHNLKTVRYYKSLGWPKDFIHVFVDDEADDIESYEQEALKQGFSLHVFSMQEARERYDYVHRASKSRRSAGQARNMFQDFARANGIEFYLVSDDDTNHYQLRPNNMYNGVVHDAAFLLDVFNAIRAFMEVHHVGAWGLSQTGDLFCGYAIEKKLLRYKLMNTVFYLMPYVYRGERGVQDDDTSLFCGLMNEGYFFGSFRGGVVLLQEQSAKNSGGLTDLYNECKLLNKSLVCPIQYPSAVHAEYQPKNGGRLHHRITRKYLMPCLVKGKRNNIAWDTYPEDVPFTNEPKRSGAKK